MGTCSFLESTSSSPSYSDDLTDLKQFAENRGFYLDQSRTNFLEKHHRLLLELKNGKLKGRNRFRELLLGVKAVGKTALVQILRDFTKAHMKDIIVVFASFDSEVRAPTVLILNAIKRLSSCWNLLNNVAKVITPLEKIELIEEWLLENNLCVLCLFDEFQGAYLKKESTGVSIVEETSVIAGSQGGTIHLIVTGSSSVLRALAFAKLKPSDCSTYPSYTKLDLNSTKLQPRWISVIKSAHDFRCFCKSHNLDRTDLRYIYSGGRPGLIFEEPDLDNIPYSLIVKRHRYQPQSREAKLMQCLLNCSTSYRSEFDNTVEEDGDNLQSFENLICNVSSTVLYTAFAAVSDGGDISGFAELLYDLTDDGMIIQQSRDLAVTVAMSGVQLYLELNALRVSSSIYLTWMEIAALKSPKDYFSVLAENVAMRIIRRKAQELFDFDTPLTRFDTTYLNFPDGTNRSNQSGLQPMFAVDSSPPAEIINIIHKEMYGYTKDVFGADSILLAAHIANPTHVDVIRVQLKLGSGTFKEADVQKFKQKMATGSISITAQLTSRGYTVRLCKNFLVTTKYCIRESATTTTEEVQSFEESLDCSFHVVDSKALDHHQVWPEAVRALGNPYGPKGKAGLLV